MIFELDANSEHIFMTIKFSTTISTIVSCWYRSNTNTNIGIGAIDIWIEELASNAHRLLN